MARPRGRIVPGEIYHVVNRGVDKRVIFRDDADYQHFLELLARGRERTELTIRGYALLSTHFHLLLEPWSSAALPEFMHWVAGRYAQDLRKHTATVGLGHIFQRRYFSNLVEDRLGCLTVLGYIEGNALTAGVVQRAEDWPWCSIYDRCQGQGLTACDDLALPDNWIEMVNLPWNEFQRALAEYDFERRRQKWLARN